MRHFTRDRSPFRVRLACVKHAASVQSEPESNSPVQICSKDLRWTEIRISKFLPVRYSLVNEPHRFTRREAVVYAASFSLSTSFFHFAKVFFAAPSGQLVGARETYVSFSNPRQELFCHPGKFLFPSSFRTWPARWRERLYAPFRPHRQAFFRKKSKKCFRTVKKALPRRAALFFNQLFVTVRLPPEKVKRFMTFFIQYVCSTDKSNKNIMICIRASLPQTTERQPSQAGQYGRSPSRQSGTRRRSHEVPWLPQASPHPAGVDSRHAWIGISLSCPACASMISKHSRTTGIYGFF